jgi:mRNA interferase HigB
MLRQYVEQGYADALGPLRAWYRAAEGADWSNFADVRRDFPSADAVGDKLIFNIGGNKYRLIVRVSYRYRRLSLKWIGTHAEYDRLTRKEIEDL